MKAQKYTPYYGTYNPNKRDYIKKIIDNQQDVIDEVEREKSKEFLPKRTLIFGGGILLVLVVLVIYKYK